MGTSRNYYVYRLRTAMRFQDPVLVAILDKMRTPGGAKLSQAERRALEATAVGGRADAQKLIGAENVYQACYTLSLIHI